MQLDHLIQSNKQYNFEHIGTYAQISQRCNHQLSQLVVTKLMLICVLNGQKKIKIDNDEWILNIDNMIFISTGQTIDITNINSSEGYYQAFYFCWDDALINDYCRKKTTLPIKSSPITLINNHFIFNQSINYIRTNIQSVQNYPNQIIRHYFLEILHWLNYFGINIGNSQQQSLHLKVRQLLNSKLEKKWNINEVSSIFAMSESTLRRHLKKEKTSLSTLIIDTKMRYGLELLQTTNWPINHIALACGYDCASRFSSRFRSRFGVSPIEIRGNA